jgi:hypothetical protein
MWWSFRTQCKLKVVFLFFGALLVVHACAYGQNVNGSIVGTITDPSNAAVPDADVTITNANTGVAQTIRTDSNGYYTAPTLPPGTYSVSTQKSGFATVQRTGITLFVGSVARADMVLNTGTVVQSVNVTSETTPALQTDTADTGRQIPTATVAELPLSTGRNFQSLLNTVPGAG